VLARKRCTQKPPRLRVGGFFHGLEFMADRVER
jgi:hypothetical protein